MNCPVQSIMVGKWSSGRHERRREPLKQTVQSCLERYLADLNGHHPNGIYQMVLTQVEQGMLETIMDEVAGNQTRAAEMLGISRSTLRKKLIQYGL